MDFFIYSAFCGNIHVRKLNKQTHTNFLAKKKHPTGGIS